MARQQNVSHFGSLGIRLSCQTENTVATGLESERLTTHLSRTQPIERDRNWGAHRSCVLYNLDLESLGFGPRPRSQQPMPNGNYSGHRYDQFCNDNGTRSDAPLAALTCSTMASTLMARPIIIALIRIATAPFISSPRPDRFEGRAGTQTVNLVARLKRLLTKPLCP
jgi:hypothetical protein